MAGAIPEQNQFKHFEITDKEFEYLRDLVYKEAGINLTPAKKCLAQTRIGKLMRRKGIDGYKELFSILETDRSGIQLETVLDAISTNHTFFFREDAHFNYLNAFILPEFKKNGINSLNIWSAGCSSGEEPYTIVMSILETQRKSLDNGGIVFDIYASDISTEVLKKAKAGVYPVESLENVPYDIKKKYFQRGKDKYSDFVKIKNQLRDYITFDRENLLHLGKTDRKYHVIFCRNVMIYFDRDTKEKVVANLAERLLPGGYLITGHSESLSGISHTLKSVKPTIYKKEN